MKTKLIVILLIAFLAGCSNGENSTIPKSSVMAHSNYSFVWKTKPNTWNVSVKPDFHSNRMSIHFTYLGKSEAVGPTLTQMNAFSISTATIKPNSQGFVMKNVPIPDKSTDIEYVLTWSQDKVLHKEKAELAIKVD